MKLIDAEVELSHRENWAETVNDMHHIHPLHGCQGESICKSTFLVFFLLWLLDSKDCHESLRWAQHSVTKKNTFLGSFSSGKIFQEDQIAACLDVFCFEAHFSKWNFRKI